MKSLQQFINEAYEMFRLNSVTVKYNVKPENFIIQAPETYQESDVQQYIDDKLLIDLPSGADHSEQFFGKNCDNIADVYFEYDGFEHIEKSHENGVNIDLEWDSKYNTSNEDEKLDLFELKNLKYVIVFDRFDILNGNDDNIKKVLEEIFNATVSNNDNKYPIEITLDPKNIEYSK